MNDNLDNKLHLCVSFCALKQVGAYINSAILSQKRRTKTSLTLICSSIHWATRRTEYKSDSLAVPVNWLLIGFPIPRGWWTNLQSTSHHPPVVVVRIPNACSFQNAGLLREDPAVSCPRATLVTTHKIDSFFLFCPVPRWMRDTTVWLTDWLVDIKDNQHQLDGRPFQGDRCIFDRISIPSRLRSLMILLGR